MGSSWDCRAPCSQGLTKYSKIVERSTDYGQTFQNLSDVPYGGQYGMNGACVVIVDEETVFMAGGRGVVCMTSALDTSVSQCQMQTGGGPDSDSSAVM